MTNKDNLLPIEVHYMEEALRLAEKGGAFNEVPVGALVVAEGKVIGRGYNCPISACDPTAHAEIQALRSAAKTLGNYRLVNCDLYVTVEPCMMCAGAIVHSRIRRLFYGTLEPKTGMVCSKGDVFALPHLNHQVQVVGGVLEKESRLLIQTFFKRRRAEGSTLKPFKR